MNFFKKFFSYYFTGHLMILQSINVIFIIFLFVCLFECLFVFEYMLNFSTSLYIIFPNKISLLLLVCLVFCLYVCGISVCRRTQFGRFTRGDRKLCLKGFASFCVVEVITLVGLLLVSCCMSCGPIVIIPRHFCFPKKGFIFELTIFTYVMCLIYLMRFSLKCQLCRTQFFITLIIILILFLLICRDLITLLFRELVSMDHGSNCRYRKTSSIVYSISSYCCLECYIGHHVRDNFSIYSPIETTMKNLYNHSYIHPFKFENILSITEYDYYTCLPFVTQNYCQNHIGSKIFGQISLFNYNEGYLYLISDPINVLQPTYSVISDTNFSTFFYPRRVGFLPKRIAMCYFLVIIKICHHFMLFICCFFYLLRLYNRRKSSYTMLAACYFNVYCCFIIGTLVYLYHVLPFLSTFMRYRPYIQSIFHCYLTIFDAVYLVIFCYFGDLFIFADYHPGLKELFYSEVFKNRSYLYKLDMKHGKLYLSFSDTIFSLRPSSDLLKEARRSAVFSNTPGVHCVSKSFFDSSIDIYTFNNKSSLNLLSKKIESIKGISKFS